MARALRSAVIAAPIEEVWERIRPFDGLPAWHPLCPDTEIEGGGSPVAVGAVRRIEQTDGNEFRERLLDLSDRDHSQTYAMLEPPRSLTSMVTTLRVYPVTDGNLTYLLWSSEIEAEKKEDETSFVGFVEDAYMTGIRSLQRIFDGGNATSWALPCGALPRASRPRRAGRPGRDLRSRGRGSAHRSRPRRRRSARLAPPPYHPRGALRELVRADAAGDPAGAEPGGPVEGGIDAPVGARSFAASEEKPRSSARRAHSASCAPLVPGTALGSAMATSIGRVYEPPAVALAAPEVGGAAFPAGYVCRSIPGGSWSCRSASSRRRAVRRRPCAAGEP